MRAIISIIGVLVHPNTDDGNSQNRAKTGVVPVFLRLNCSISAYYNNYVEI